MDKLVNDFVILPNPFPEKQLFLHKVMINVTEKAKERIVELRHKDGLTDNHQIRVAVHGGGCSGLMYDLNFDTDTKPTDEIFEDQGIKILVDRKSLLYLLGTTLDFSDGLNGKGFQFINPNASRTCGCGESFSI
jgi:iron-sulfur cluster assembly protein